MKFLVSDPSKGQMRSLEVTSLFANNMRSKGDRDVELMSMRLSRKDASIDIYYDLLGSPRDLDLP